jgi:protein involved in polysaccharide export with SLBB domain
MILVVLCCLSIASMSFAALVKGGDVLDITVINHPEFSGRFTVDDNGTIPYPLLADEPIVNINTSELMHHLTFRLAKHIDNPLVLIGVVERPEIQVTVLGQVKTPGPVRAYQGVSLQEVVTLAGGAAERADLRRIKIVSSRMPNQPARFYDLRTFMTEGSVESMPRLDAGDIVVVLEQEHPNQVKVIGGVRSPGFFEMTTSMNLFEAIYLAGGPAEKADLSRVRRFSTIEGKSLEEVVDIQDYIDKGTMNQIPAVNQGDVIIVYTKWFDWKTLLSILNNTLLVVVTLQAFSGIMN